MHIYQSGIGSWYVLLITVNNDGSGRNENHSGDGHSDARSGVQNEGSNNHMDNHRHSGDGEHIHATDNTILPLSRGKYMGVHRSP
ncbi:MAG: hypothetical protein V3U02_04790 [Calditrichia bacterium]